MKEPSLASTTGNNRIQNNVASASSSSSSYAQQQQQHQQHRRSSSSSSSRSRLMMPFLVLTLTVLASMWNIYKSTTTATITTTTTTDGIHKKSRQQRQDEYNDNFFNPIVALKNNSTRNPSSGHHSSSPKNDSNNYSSLLVTTNKKEEEEEEEETHNNNTQKESTSSSKKMERITSTAMALKEESPLLLPNAPQELVSKTTTMTTKPTIEQPSRKNNDTNNESSPLSLLQSKTVQNATTTTATTNINEEEKQQQQQPPLVVNANKTRENNFTTTTTKDTSPTLPFSSPTLPTTTIPLNQSESSSQPSSSVSSGSQQQQQHLVVSRDYLQTRVPAWFLEYMDWHQQQLLQLDTNNWNNGTFRYSIMRCTNRDRTCGGISDRLKPLALQLRMAYVGKRIFFIRWERPYPLEEFLQPTQHFNWTVPYYIRNVLEDKKRKQMYRQQKKNKNNNNNNKQQQTTLILQQNQSVRSLFQMDNTNEDNNNLDTNFYGFGKDLAQTLPETLRIVKQKYPILLEDKIQMSDGGAGYFIGLFENKTDTSDTYQTVYHGIFRALFQPSPPVATLVTQQLQRIGLVPGDYSVAHLRAFHAKKMEDVPRRVQKALAINAVNCASQLQPGAKVYFASDSAYASQAVQEYAIKYNYTNFIFTNSQMTGDNDTGNATNTTSNSNTNSNPLHLEFASRGNKTWPVEAYYDIFVDLLVLGNARCVSLGMGGYGAYANFLSYDSTCSNRHMAKATDRVILTCDKFLKNKNDTVPVSAKKQNKKKKKKNQKKEVDKVTNDGTNNTTMQ